RELLRALGRLPFNQRAAITMRELEGRSYPEIAETLGVTVPAVEALLARARRTLRLHAGAIRGLTVVGLPRSLQRLFQNGEATPGRRAPLRRARRRRARTRRGRRPFAASFRVRRRSSPFAPQSTERARRWTRSWTRS